jgi:hypothetical protein
MTAVLIKPDSPSQWGSMPGWNIVADLTPPELINSRALAVLRKRILVALVIVVLLCVGGYVYSMSKYGAASDANDAATTQTVTLQHETTKYAPITRIENTVDAIRGQVASVMQGDVDVPAVVAALRAALPNSMSIGSMSLTLTPAVSGAEAPVGLDASGRPIVGSINISGTGKTLDDLPSFVDRLSAVKGVVNVLPTSNQMGNDPGNSIVQFNVTLSLTDQVYSHRYDVANTGGK